MINKDKYKNAILFFVKHCNNEYLGETKLNKLMYYLDFISYRDRAKSVTGDIYIHKDYGPVPNTIDDVVVEMKSEGKIKVEEIPYKNNGKVKFESLDNPDMSLFDDYEKDLLSKLCKEFELWQTTQIVSQTHLEAPWFYSDPFDVVDYKYASDIDFFTKNATMDF